MISQYSADFFARSPVLILPVIGMLIFFTVFVVAVVRTYLRPRHSFDKLANLPLDEEK